MFYEGGRVTTKYLRYRYGSLLKYTKTLDERGKGLSST